jgi:putative FmdB family regulatory protein
MPLYEYECESCGARFELIHRFTDAPAEKCKTCGGGPVHRLLSAPAIQFKGSGWYITDYARKGKSDEAAAGAPAGDGKSGSASDAASSDTSKPAPAATTTTTTDSK